jgi:hypothetical protein
MIDLIAVRKTTADTTRNSILICELMGLKQCRITFFATSSIFDGEEGARSYYSDTNLPVMCALVELEVPHFGKQYVVFDGHFLTATRYPRYLDIKAVLNEAEVAGNCFFSKSPAPFTANKSASEAAKMMLNLGDVQPLNSETRHIYFSLLSPHLTETQYQESHKT